MFRLLAFIAFFLCFCDLAAQNREIDSATTAIMRGRLQQVESISLNNLDAAFHALDSIESDFKNSGNENLWTEFLLLKANFFLASKEHDSIIKLLIPVVEDFDHASTPNKANAYLHIGHAYKLAWVPDSALVNYIKALRFYEKADNQRGLSLTYLALGLTYDKLKSDDMAAHFFDKSIEYSTNSKIIEMHKKEITNREIRPVSVNRTLELSHDIAKIAEQQGNKRLLMVAYSDLKRNYFELKKYDEALEYAYKELEMIEATAANALLPKTNTFVGSIYMLQNKYDKAIKKFQEALPNAPDSLRLNIYQNLKQIYDREGNSKAALAVLEQYVVLKDSMTSRKSEASIARVMAQFKTELQEEQIKSLSFENELNTTRIAKQRTTLFGTIGASLLLLILGLLGYKNYKTRQELGQSQLNFKLLQTQMNPHFMFNALNEINASLTSNDSENTSHYLTAYSKLMRSILQSSSHEFVSIAEDIALISNYLKLQQLVHDHHFTFEVSVSEEIDTHYLQIPPMLTQPYVENAILHGVHGISEGHIRVNYQLKDDYVEIEIADNGKGIVVKEHSGNELHTSMGTTIIEQRVETYRKLHKFDIDINTRSGDAGGTTILLRFPIKILTQQ